jgi:hypothetical protein
MHSPEHVIVLQVPCSACSDTLDDGITESSHIGLDELGKLSTQFEDEAFFRQSALDGSLGPWQVALACPVQFKTGSLEDR